MVRIMFLMVLLSLFFVPFVLCEGAGEVNVTGTNSLYMSYDSVVRDVSSPFVYNSEGFPIYFVESDPLIGVNYSIVGDMLYFGLVRNPSRVDNVFRHNFHICFLDEVRELRRFEVFNDGSFCPVGLFHYEFSGNNAVLEGFTYEFRVPRSLDGVIPPFLWFIGGGAGGGGGCLVVPTVTNVFPFVGTIPSSYELNSQSNVGFGSTWTGTGDIFGMEAQLWRSEDQGSWSVVPIGSSSNVGVNTVDCNGISCRVTNIVNGVTYYKAVDFQQRQDDLRFSTSLVCAGQWWDGLLGTPVSTSIVDSVVPYPVWRFPTPDDGGVVYVSDPLLNVTPVDDHVPVFSFWEFYNDVLGYWTMDYYNSTTVKDNSSYENDLTLNTITSADWDDGISGLAPDFPLSFSFLGLDETIFLTENMTLSLWYFLESATGSYKMLIGDNTANSHIGVWYDNRLRLKESDGTTFDFSGAGVIGRWNHLVIRNNVSHWSIFNNGVLVGNVSQSGGVNINRIGHAYSTSSYSWNGDIDEVIIFNRSLADADILSLFNSSYDNLQYQYFNLSVGRYDYTLWLNDVGGNVVSFSRSFNVSDSVCFCGGEYCGGDWVLSSDVVCPVGEFVPLFGDLFLNGYFLAVSGISFKDGAVIAP